MFSHYLNKSLFTLYSVFLVAKIYLLISNSSLNICFRVLGDGLYFAWIDEEEDKDLLQSEAEVFLFKYLF